MSEKKAVIDSVMRATQAQDDEAFLSHLTDDIVYHYHVGSRPLIGKDWVKKFLGRYRETVSDATWEIHRMAETDDAVLVEGREEYLDLRTGDRVAHPYMGVFEFRDGLICGWRDYFEMDYHEPQ